MIKHIPVLLDEVLKSIPETTTFLVDGTLGHGGHTQAILDKFPQISVLGIDRDPNIFSATQEKLAGYANRFQAKQGSYADIDTLQSKKSDYILLDIGVNMEHYKDTSRGFSIKGEGPLDMRFDPTKGLSAQQRIARVSAADLETCFIDYADFTPEKARELANAILRARTKYPLTTTRQLRQVLYDCGLGDPASSVIFQAIRIQVNQELEQLKIFLQKLPDLLNKGGRCAIITFHSIEDRIVKNAFKEFPENQRVLYSKKAIQPTYKEIEKNKASRSAKLRIIEKI
ncbi:S-adenosyl-methyltransferase MraW [candidate division SR1 bacterium RAAC1_SR1_1]|nr:S-adenosyl-methyltransferase MraW [candidate division SR1 bacterium RAAC1_SR1_1]